MYSKSHGPAEGEYEDGLRKKGNIKEYYEGKLIFEAIYSCDNSYYYNSEEKTVTISEKSSNNTKSYTINLKT